MPLRVTGEAPGFGQEPGARSQERGQCLDHSLDWYLCKKGKAGQVNSLGPAEGFSEL